jgi:hypothetical protein
MAGQQNYLILTQEDYFDKFENDLIKSADLFYLNRKFGIGDGPNIDKLRHSQMLHNILCTDECELIDWVWKKINGESEDTTHKIKMNDFQVYDIPFGINELNNKTNECCNWAQLEW